MMVMMMMMMIGEATVEKCSVTFKLQLHCLLSSHPDPSFTVILLLLLIIITRPWLAFGRQGLVGSSFEYSYTCLASRLRRSARSEIITWGNDPFIT